MIVELTEKERDFIVDNALNGLWSHSLDRLSEPHLGDIEKRNIRDTAEEAKRLMLKLDPNCLG